jgi:hypothetical protein
LPKAVKPMTARGWWVGVGGWVVLEGT